MSRPARVGDQLTTRDFGTGTLGFSAQEDPKVAVCVLPGTELAFAKEVTIRAFGFLGLKKKSTRYTTAVFRQINKSEACRHHDSLEFPDGNTVLLTWLWKGQKATVLQLPAQPTTSVELERQRRAEYIG